MDDINEEAEDGRQAARIGIRADGALIIVSGKIEATIPLSPALLRSVAHRMLETAQALEISSAAGRA